MKKMKKKDFYQRNKNNIYLSILITIACVIIIGCIVFPQIFYDQWIWKYYWGPIVADADPNSITAVHNGVIAQEGYTLISEITYGVILIISLFLIYKLLRRLKITVDWKFALALMPYILFGPVSRTLEDAQFFSEPIVYWFISPLIYLQIAVYALFFLILGFYLEKKLKKRIITVNNVLFIGGLIFLIPSTLFLILKGLESNIVRFDVFLLIFVIVGFITALVFLISHKFKSNKKIKPYKNPLNLAMLFGHLLDGITSYISIKDPLNMGLSYAEKHPASNFLLETWGPLFPIVKFILVILVIYLFDILYKEELKDYMVLVNLLKIGILILGFSPGLRDLLRVTIGV
jgi:uncharacterized membrane protein